MSKWTLFLAILVSAHTVYATDAAIKTYHFSHIHLFVSNHVSCKPLYKELKKLTTKPIALQFTNSTDSNFDVKETTGHLVNFTYKIVAQETNNSMVSRIGLGSFEVNHTKVDYIIEIAGDTKKRDFKYFYPLILSSTDAHCYFTALLKPDNKTIKTFKKSITSGDVGKETDLMVQ